ncbi:MAG: hypothetical protein IPK21_22870 [Haliscomenobacter sp.]|nr:hypothetical protein [Haliscomenobacter sp.]
MGAFQPKSNFIIRPEYKKDLREYLYLNEESARHFDYIWLLSTVHRILEDNNAMPFLQEISSITGLLRTDKTTYGAYRFLEQELRQRLLRQDILAGEVAALCQDAEKQLGVLLKTCGFLSAYEFISVKGISVRKRRCNSEPAFIHEKAVLRGRDLTTVDKKSISRREFTDDRSILVTRSLAGEAGHIPSLAPFLVDLNAFSPKGHALPRLFVFHHRAGQDGLVYQDTQVMDEYFTIDSQYSRLEFQELELLQDLMRAFEQDLKL